MKLFCFFILWFLGLFANCQNSKLDSLAFFTPFTNIGIIEKGNKIEFDDSLTSIAQQNIINIINNGSVLSSKKEIKLQDSFGSIIVDETQGVVKKIFKNKSIDGIVIPRVTDSFLKANNQRFALLVFLTGFERTTKNKQKQTTKNIAVTALSLGNLVPIYQKQGFSLVVLLLDSKFNRFVFYKTCSSELSSATFRMPLEVKFNELFRKYTYKEKEIK